MVTGSRNVGFKETTLHTQAIGRLRRVSPVDFRPGEDPFSEPTTAAYPWLREPAFVPIRTFAGCIKSSPGPPRTAAALCEKNRVQPDLIPDIGPMAIGPIQLRDKVLRNIAFRGSPEPPGSKRCRACWTDSRPNGASRPAVPSRTQRKLSYRKRRQLMVNRSPSKSRSQG